MSAPDDRSISEALAALARLQSEQESPISKALSEALGNRDSETPFMSLARAFALSKAVPIQRKWFKNETVHIDGYIFEDCRFDGCQLVTALATFTFRRCFIAPNCRLSFDGPALKTARLLMHFLRVQGRVQVREGELSVYATLNTDGTFSLE